MNVTPECSRFCIKGAEQPVSVKTHLKLTFEGVHPERSEQFKIIMKTALILVAIFCAAFAAPAEEKKAVEAAVEEPKEEMVVAEAVMEEQKEEKMVAAAPVSEEIADADERYISCPDGWFFHGSRCFLFVNTPMSWYNAEDHCNNMGGSLASATSRSEYSYLQRLAQTGGQSLAWLGGFNLQGQWMWIDRQGFYYTNWYGQSSSSTSLCIYLRTTNGWGNTQCTSSQRFICSKNPFGC